MFEWIVKLPALLTKQRDIGIPASVINSGLSREELRPWLEKQRLENLSAAVEPGELRVAGTYLHKLQKVRVEVVLKPLPLRWNERQHELRFKLLRHDVSFDESAGRAATAVVNALLLSFLGKGLFRTMLKPVLEGRDTIVVKLDELGGDLVPVLRCLDVRQFVCQKDRVVITVRGRVEGLAGLPMAAGKLLFEWWQRTPAT